MSMRAIPTLKISISGVRGVIGDSLTPALLTRFAQAFGTHMGAGTIVIGRDPRTSGEMVKHAVIAGRMAYRAGRIPRKMYATASSPVEGLVGR